VLVRLAGYNVDIEALREWRDAVRRLAESGGGAPGPPSPAEAARARELLSRDDLTPETLSAAYARISRDPRPVDDLRAAARMEVAKARRSNETIIFGLGHASVAEHAVFNLDVIGVSRLAVEEIERCRLASYTERSQRYVTLEDDFVRPAEIMASPFAARFIERVRAQNDLYRRLLERLLARAIPTGAADEAGSDARRDRENLCKEDARYATSMSAEAQLGMTINARSLERMIARTAASGLAEVRDVSRALFEAVSGVAPSVVKRTAPDDFQRSARDDVVAAARAAGPVAAVADEVEPVRRVAFTPDADLRVIASLLHAGGSASYETCLARAAAMTPGDREAFVRTSLRRLRSWDAPLREFEHVGATFELVVSASCFAQLKRHRMATITAQPYDPALGATIPDSVRGAGMERELIEECRRAAALHAEMAPLGPAAAYGLLNAHRRRVLVTMNAREMYHVSRLREDAHAQWDIRAIAARLIALAREVMPLTLLLAAGKDRFDERRAGVFGPGGVDREGAA
jgi:flavin-dependent thymidylate synthase